MGRPLILHYQMNNRYRKMSKILSLFGRCDTMLLRVTGKMYETMPNKELQYFRENYAELRKAELKDFLSYELERNPWKIDFDAMYDDMLKEYLLHYEKTNAENEDLIDNCAYLFSNDCMSIYSDELRSAYKVSSVLWEWICEDVEQTVIFTREILPRIQGVDSLELEVLNLPENAPLKNNFIKCEYDLSLTPWVYFELNDETKKWLLRYRLDGDLFKTGLEDLALIYKGEVKFNSVTHERMNTIESRHIKERYLH